MTIKELIMQLVYPRVCPICGEVLPWSISESVEHAKTDPYICRDCLKKIIIVTGTRCLKCSKPIESEEEEYCHDCAGRTNYFEEGKALWLHDGYARKIIYALKFSGIRDNADFIGYEMARRLGPWLMEKKVDALLPVPLHRSKQRSRGFNQAQLIAASLAKWMENMYGYRIPIDSGMLVRTVRTKPQKDLDPRYRFNNIRGAFEADDTAAGRRICLVDDIYTTGSTINEAARTLKRAGAEKVFFITANIGI
ncbi:MAG: ComF family protein [Lachnospiraceae bacterium]|nr:ComF family protein [Lachnospiraceae bacterium]